MVAALRHTNVEVAKVGAGCNSLPPIATRVVGMFVSDSNLARVYPTHGTAIRVGGCASDGRAVMAIRIK